MGNKKLNIIIIYLDSGDLRPFSTTNMVPFGFRCQAIKVPESIGFPFYGSLYYTAYVSMAQILQI